MMAEPVHLFMVVVVVSIHLPLHLPTHLFMVVVVPTHPSSFVSGLARVDLP